jgi:cytochrome c
VNIDVAGNQTFYFPGEPINYKVFVTDREDGAAPPAKVAFSIDQVAETFDIGLLAQGDAPVDPSTRFAVAKAIIGQSDCRNCHNADSKSNGPAWVQIAEKYKGDAAAQEKLAEKVRTGGRGVWPDLPGEGNMPAHPGLSIEETRSIIQYIMNIQSDAIAGAPYISSSGKPLEGTFAATGTNKLVLRAVYTDMGAKDLASHTVERIAVRRNPIVSAVSADDSSGMMRRVEGNGAVETMASKPGGFLMWRNIDLTGIRELQIAATAPGVIALKPTSAPRDLYLVVRNSNAKAEEMTVSIATITFVK